MEKKYVIEVALGTHKGKRLTEGSDGVFVTTETVVYTDLDKVTEAVRKYNQNPSYGVAVVKEV